MEVSGALAPQLASVQSYNKAQERMKEDDLLGRLPGMQSAVLQALAL